MSEGLAIVLATHLMQCSQCQRTLAEFEAIGGALLDTLPPVPLASGALDQLFDRPEQQTCPVLNAALPPPLDRVPMRKWWPIGNGLRWRPLRVGGIAWAGLILAQPGRVFPRHGHSGIEFTCVLSGAFADGGYVYAAGDLDEPDANHDHPPMVVSAEPCLCVIASEGMRLRGVLGRAQRLFGL